MALLTAQAIADTGLEATYAACTGGGDTVVAGSKTFLHVKNGSGGDLDVTLTTPALFDGLAVADPVTTVTAGEERFIGPLDPKTYGASGTNLVSIGYSGVTSLTIAAVYLP